MINKGTLVQHQSFGVGRIIDTTAETISVVFNNGKKCNFLAESLGQYLSVVESPSETVSCKAPKIIYASTNAEFLNQAFGTNYKAWMKCGWNYGEDTIVWMIPFDDKVRDGWKNTIVDENTVREDFVGHEWDKLPAHKHLEKYRRIVVKKEEGRYIILGLYRYDFENSVERNKRIWIKISDEIV